MMFNTTKEKIKDLKQREISLDADLQQEGHPLLNFYVKIMPVVLHAERCSIFIHDPYSKTTWLKVGTGLEERDIEVTAEHDSVVGKVITTGEHVIINEMEKQEGYHEQVAEDTGFVTRNMLCACIKSVFGDQVVGAVQLLNKKDGSEFDEDDVKLVEEMAHYLELTIENIYFNQEVTEVLDLTFNKLESITYLLMMSVIVIAVFMSFGIVGYILSLFN